MKTLALILALFFLPSTLTAQAQPTRLIQAADLEHRGSFTLANAKTCGQYDTEYVNGAVAVSGSLLYMAGHDVCSQGVAVWQIPASRTGQAAVSQAAVDVTGGRLAQINTADPGQKSIGGLLLVGDRLVASAYSGYDGAGTASASHFTRSASGVVSGPFRVGNLNPAFYAGYMAAVPPVWQAALGGDTLTGQCCLSIISRTSFGPSVSAVNGADLSAGRNPSPATMLVGYPEGNQTLGMGTAAGAWTQADRVTGVAVIEASVLFIGRHGTGAYCYGDVPPCNDPEDGSKGTHAYPYQPHVWAYRAADLADVKAGRKQPWDVTPYATFRLPSAIGSSRIGGATWDAATATLFVVEKYGDGAKPRVHALSVRDVGTAPPVVTPPPVVEPPVTPPPPPPVTPAPQGWVLDWSDEFDGAAVDTSIWNVISGVGTYGGTQQTFNPANVTVNNGVLRLQARKEGSGSRPFTSGAVTSQNKRTFAPEFRLEIRASLPVFRGVWSMLWTREGTMPNPDVGVEIDVMENIGDSAVSYFTLHRWNGSSNQTVTQCAPYKPGYTGMHTFAVEVVGGKATWFLDGVQVCGPANDAPRIASYLIMDLAIGGTWGGTADVNQAMPQNMDIDFVRVYRKGTAPPPPAPVDAVVSAWSDWTGGTWSACSAGTQTRTETRTRTIVTAAANGGSTPALSETRTASQSCVVEPPPPPPPVDPCVAAPGVLTVSSWPSSAEGARQLRYSYSVSGVVTTVRTLLVDLVSGRVTATDARGCVSEARR